MHYVKMNEQDSLSTYSLWAKQASIFDEKEPNDSGAHQKSEGVDRKENMDEERRAKPMREDSGYGIKTRKEAKHAPTRTRIVPSSESEDTVQSLAEGVQAALAPTPPNSQYKDKDDEYASTTRKLARASIEKRPVDPKNAITAAKSKRDNQPPELGAAAKAAREAEKDLSKQSWSRRALARTKDILSITAKEPSAFAFEDYRNKEFKRAGVKAGDNAAAKLHVSSQKLPPEAPKPQSKEAPPINRNVTDANAHSNRSMPRISSSKARNTPNLFRGRGKDGSNHSLVSSGSRGSSAILGEDNGRVSFQGNEGGSGSGSDGTSDMGQPLPPPLQVMGPPKIGPPRLMYSQTDGASMRTDTACKIARGVTPTKVLSGKQKAAAIDDRW